MSRPLATITGTVPANFANAISDVLRGAIMAGMAIDEACCVAAAVIADYGRGEYGDGYLDDLARVVKARAEQPLPRGIA